MLKLQFKNKETARKLNKQIKLITLKPKDTSKSKGEPESVLKSGISHIIKTKQKNNENTAKELKLAFNDADILLNKVFYLTKLANNLKINTKAKSNNLIGEMMSDIISNNKDNNYAISHNSLHLSSVGANDAIKENINLFIKNMTGLKMFRVKSNIENTEFFIANFVQLYCLYYKNKQLDKKLCATPEKFKDFINESKLVETINISGCKHIVESSEYSAIKEKIHIIIREQAPVNKYQISIMISIGDISLVFANAIIEELEKNGRIVKDEILGETYYYDNLICRALH